MTGADKGHFYNRTVPTRRVFNELVLAVCGRLEWSLHEKRT